MIALISGGFDPLHIGHIELIELAAAHGDVIVALNSDDWLMRKKQYVFMSYEERSRILRAIRNVVSVVPVDDQDDTVCSALEKLKPDFFVNGGDRQDPHLVEDAVCKRLNITQIFGGGKIQSSSNLVDRIK
jgi:D-beta-D-heptose 7-phosphate kinase/D-beta-D-heptose 1-phosphate adenosyltransferase